MQYCLDGSDWEADYFISDADYVHWQDNYITLVPGEERVVAAVVTAGMENPGAVTVSAWNSPVKRISIK